MSFRVGIGEPMQEGEDFVLSMSIGHEGQIVYFPVPIAKDLITHLTDLVTSIEDVNTRLKNGASRDEVATLLKEKYGLVYEETSHVAHEITLRKPS